MNYKLLLPSTIIFEKGSSFKLGQYIKDIINNPLIITGGQSIHKNGNYEKIINSLKQENLRFVEYKGVSGEPTTELIDEVTEFAYSNKIDGVVAIGGGSVIDTGKAVSALVVNEKGIANYLEGVGKDYKIINNPLPFVALPTTSGSGAEATKNSVVTSRIQKYKKSFRDDRLMAKKIIVDPMLLLSLSMQNTAYCGMDAICQLIESYVTKNRNSYTQSLAAYFLPQALKSIIKAYDEPENIEARFLMAEASLASGIALANSGLGAVHGFASGIGGMFDIPHGLICAILLAPICELNSKKNNKIYKEIAPIVNQDKSQDIDKFINYLYILNEKLRIPKNFKDFNISKNQAVEIVQRSLGSSMSCNPFDFTEEELVGFISSYL